MVDFSLSFHEIRSPSDDLLLPWLDLYETAFPCNERILVSSFLRLLKLKEVEPGSGACLLAAIQEAKDLVGIACYDTESKPTAGLLWYMAVVLKERGQGIGSLLYQEIVRRVRLAGSKMLIFEVEKPELAHSEEARLIASRRIEFYRRQGARRLTGIDYTQTVGAHQPPTPMHLMAQPFENLSAEDIFKQALWIFDGQISQTGRLELDQNELYPPGVPYPPALSSR